MAKIPMREQNKDKKRLNTFVLENFSPQSKDTTVLETSQENGCLFNRFKKAENGQGHDLLPPSPTA
jgi:hypothetical protein